MALIQVNIPDAALDKLKTDYKAQFSYRDKLNSSEGVKDNPQTLEQYIEGWFLMILKSTMVSIDAQQQMAAIRKASEDKLSITFGEAK